jgi:hypothetical protein
MAETIARVCGSLSRRTDYKKIGERADAPEIENHDVGGFFILSRSGGDAGNVVRFGRGFFIHDGMFRQEWYLGSCGLAMFGMSFPGK